MVQWIAFNIGRLRLFVHVAWHVLALSNEPHRGIRDARWRRDFAYSLRSLELRCLCGRIYYQYWTNDLPRGRVRR